MLVADTDFLSAFLKLGELDLVLSYFDEDAIHVPTAVLREIAQTDLLESFNENPSLEVRAPPDVDLVGDVSRLGAGETACIRLCGEEDLLLMDDRLAADVAEKNDVSVTSIPGFLWARLPDSMCVTSRGGLSEARSRWPMKEEPVRSSMEAAEETGRSGRRPAGRPQEADGLNATVAEAASVVAFDSKCPPGIPSSWLLPFDLLSTARVTQIRPAVYKGQRLRNPRPGPRDHVLARRS